MQPVPIYIALCTDDTYITIILASMLMDMGYHLTPDLHKANVLITDQPAYLSVQLPIIFLYENTQPALKRNGTLPCVYMEKPVGIELLHRTINQLTKQATMAQSTEQARA